MLVVAAVFIGARGGSRPAGSRSGETVRVAFLALPTAQVPVVTKAALSRTVEIMRERLHSVFTDVQVSSSGRTLVVVVRHAPPGARARVVALSAAARLEFYDWEATALTPNGKTVASQLQAQDRQAVAISQGSGSAAPGEPGAGSMTLYDAVRLASRQPALHSADGARPARSTTCSARPEAPPVPWPPEIAARRPHRACTACSPAHPPTSRSCCRARPRA